jgi:2-methylisocitrate lyase-like PEP mutase family enzyme
MNASATLRKLLDSREVLVMPDAYDPMSARIIASCGFEAVQCSGFSMSLAACLKSEADLDLNANLAITKSIVQVVDAPVMADGEDGYGNPEKVSETIRRFVAIGVAGINIEDQALGSTGRVEVVDEHLMIEKIQAAREAARSSGNAELVINARTDALLAEPDRPSGLREAIRRANLYLEAGADLAFVTYVANLDEAKAAVTGIDGPVSIAAGQAYNMNELSVENLRECGVARISVPTVAVRAAIGALWDVMREIRESGQFAPIDARGALCDWRELEVLSGK